MESIAFILLIAGVIGSVLPLLPGPLLSSVGLILFAQTNDLSQNVGFWLYLWAITGLLFFIGDYLLPGIITKRGGGSKEATRGATIGLLLGLITGPGMFIGAFVGAFIGQYRSNTNIVKSLRSALLATLGIVLGIIGKLIYTVAAVALVLLLVST